MIFGAMKLSEARLCLDCEVVFAGPFCPVCGGVRAPFISLWLNRKEAEDENHQREEREKYAA